MGLNYLFVDMNAYFASVEQQERPELRGRPVGVVAVMAETTCCIAASYEAKRFGVKTGTMVRDARRLCPEIQIIQARPKRYVEVHHRIIDAVAACIPVDKVLSIDEMICKLQGDERLPAGAVGLAGRVKESIRHMVGEHLRCSVGIGPNRLLAKVASDMQKPDGLTVIHPEELPQRLYGQKLTDFPGVGPRMAKRLTQAGVTDVRQFCALSAKQLSAIWGSSLLGTAWWYKLRGEDLPERPTRRRSLSHSRVLAPERRNDEDAWAVVVRMTHTAAARLRHTLYWAGSVTVHVSYLDRPRWHAQRRIDQCQDTLTLVREIEPLWRTRPRGKPLKVGVVFADLQHESNRTPSLFEPEGKLVDLAKAMDAVGRRFGASGAFFAAMHGQESQSIAPIAFIHVPDLDVPGT